MGGLTALRFFVNELALGEACASTDPPHAPLAELLGIRKRSEAIGAVLYCSGQLSLFQTPSGVALHTVVQQMSLDERKIFMSWITKRGPFIEHDRQEATDDLFYFEDVEVTELGLGEAARRILGARKAAVFSVVSKDGSRFATTPLDVVHGFSEEPLDHLLVPNCWTEPQLEAAILAESPEPETWSEFLAYCRTRYNRLLISDHCDATLRSHPYGRGLAAAIEKRLEVLQELMCNMQPDGALTTEGQALRDQHFKGEVAPFSDESSKRKRRNPERFRFPNPDGDGSLVCTWHGKVRPRFFRIHFEWPVPPRRRTLRVCYMGPKL